MGPLSAPEQHALAFRSNALTSAHPSQTKCQCAAFPPPGLTPHSHLAPHRPWLCLPLPPLCWPGGACHSAQWDPRRGHHQAGLPRGRGQSPSPGCTAEPRCVPIPHGWCEALLGPELSSGCSSAWHRADRGDQRNWLYCAQPPWVLPCPRGAGASSDGCKGAGAVGMCPPSRWGHGMKSTSAVLAVC